MQTSQLFASKTIATNNKRATVQHKCEAQTACSDAICLSPRGAAACPGQPCALPCPVDATEARQTGLDPAQGADSLPTCLQARQIPPSRHQVGLSTRHQGAAGRPALAADHSLRPQRRECGTQEGRWATRGCQDRGGEQRGSAGEVCASFGAAMPPTPGAPALRRRGAHTAGTYARLQAVSSFASERRIAIS
jgi:hypothetical protein